MTHGCMFDFNVGHPGLDVLVAFDGAKTFLSIKQHTGEPALGHRGRTKTDLGSGTDQESLREA